MRALVFDDQNLHEPIYAAWQAKCRSVVAFSDSSGFDAPLVE